VLIRVESECYCLFNETLLCDIKQNTYRAGKFEEVRNPDTSVHKCTNQPRTAKTDVYILLNKRPYFTGYVLQILLHFVVIITKKDMRLMRMVPTRSAMLSCSNHRHCSVVTPLTKFQVMSVDTASTHWFVNSYMPWKSTGATPRTLCDGELHITA
jgi:hypothetical protein